MLSIASATTIHIYAQNCKCTEYHVNIDMKSLNNLLTLLLHCGYL